MEMLGLEGDTNGGGTGSSQYRDLDEVKASLAAERKLPIGGNGRHRLIWNLP